MLLRNRLLGGIGHGALFAAETGAGSAPAPDATATPAPSPSSSADSAAPAPPAATAGSTDVAAASASAAAAPSSAEAAPAQAAPAKPDSAGSLLAEAAAKAPGEAEGAKPEAKPDAKAEVKPDATKPVEPPAPAKPEAKAEGEAPAPAKEALAETPPARTYENFKVPEGLKLDDARIKDFTSILDNAELSHQDRGQKLVDMFVDEATKLTAARDQHQRDVFDQLQNGWKEELRTDPQVGGNRLETSLGRAKWVVEQFGGDEKQVGSLLAQLSYTGMGNNVGLVRLLDNVAEMLSEGEIVPASPRPAKDTRSRADRWYEKQNGATG
jgi:hypothetical protein